MGSIVSGILSLIGSRMQAKRLEAAAAPAQAASGAQMDLLGVGGGDPSTSQNAFNNYLNSTGYQFQQKAGQDAITGSAAAGGLLNSGSTARALQDRGQEIGANYFNNYLGQLGNAAQTSLGPAQLATDAAGSRAGGFNAFTQAISAPLVRRFGY